MRYIFYNLAMHNYLQSSFSFNIKISLILCPPLASLPSTFSHHYHDKIKTLRCILLSAAGKYHEQIHISKGATGYSYEHVFDRFLDQTLTEVTVEDPYIRSTHQIYNFLRFCELFIAASCKLKKISLITGRDEVSLSHYCLFMMSTGVFKLVSYHLLIMTSPAVSYFIIFLGQQ